MTKICKRCFREFDESEVDGMDISPARVLADTVIEDLSIGDVNDLCPECKEELGVMNLLGFGQ